jgi:hypothetical protein
MACHAHLEYNKHFPMHSLRISDFHISDVNLLVLNFLSYPCVLSFCGRNERYKFVEQIKINLKER